MKKKRAKQILAMLLSLVLIITTVISPSATVFATTAQNATRSITLDVKSKVTMYEEFGTGKKDTFLAKRNDGEYDKGFYGIVPTEKSRGR